MTTVPAFPTAAWTGTANITTFRRDYVRDLVDASTPPTIYLSAYNRAIKAQFFTDAAIDAMKTRVETDYAEELASLYATKDNERTDLGDTAGVATTAATATLLDSTMRLVRALCREAMMADAGFIGSVSDEKQRGAMFGVWAGEIARDRTFARVRAGSFAAIPLVRF